MGITRGIFETLVLCWSTYAVGVADASSVACNNSPALCDRSYGNISQLAAHDSPFVRDAANEYSLSGDQFYNSTVQLSAGVRMLTAQVYSVNSTWHLCHTDCSLLDAGLLSDWLRDIGSWLDSNPHEVVTLLLVNSNDATAGDLAEQYEAANVSRYAYTPASKTATSDWPTLQSLIDHGTRLLTFVASLSDNSAAPYLMDEFTYLFENNYDNLAASDFSCVPNRPPSLAGNTKAALSSGRLPAMNHFLYVDIGDGIEIPAVNNASNTNALTGRPGNLGSAAKTCTEQYGRVPAFVLVDFFNVGPAIDTVDELNGILGQAVGRATVATDALPATTTADSASGSVSATSFASSTSTTTGSSVLATTVPVASAASSSRTTTSAPTSSSSAAGVPGARPCLMVILCMAVLGS